MDDDLKIVLKAELEADESASAQRISAQLPNISKLINNKSAIKIGISLDDTKIQSQAKRLSSQLDTISSKSNINMKFNFGEEKIEELKNALSQLKFPDNLIDRFISNIHEANTEVRSISTSFDEVKNVVTATVNGINRMGEQIRQVQSARIVEYDDGHVEAEQIKNVIGLAKNYEQLAKEEEKAAAAAKAVFSSNIKDVQKLEYGLDKAKYAWDGLNKTVTQESHVAELQSEYERVLAEIKKLSVEGDRFGSDTINSIQIQIDRLTDLANAYAKLEKAPTELRAKDVSVIKEEQLYRLETFETKLSNSGILTEELSRKIALLRTELGGVGDANGITAFMDKFGVVKAQAESVKATMASIRMSEDAQQSVQRVRDEMDLTGQRVDELRDKYSRIGESVQSVDARLERIARLQGELNAMLSDPSAKLEDILSKYQALDVEIDDCTASVNMLNRAQSNDTGNFVFQEKLVKAKADLDTIARTWSAFRSDPGLRDQFQQLEASIKNVNNQMDLRKWTAQFSTFKSEIKAAGKNMLSLGDTIKNNVGKVLQWVSATTLLFRAFRLLKQAISTVIDLDTAMIDLQKVTTATTAAYQKFYASANDTAKALGVTTEAIISQTAEWARLGYSLEEAAKLAENSAIFASISPGMDIDTATSGIVSTIKAFGIETEDVLDGVISKINQVGNTAALSNSDIVEALSNSASAMAAMNGTLDETIALITAAQEITQDASKVGKQNCPNIQQCMVLHIAA